MRIALLCNEYPPLPHGGIGTFTHTLAHELARQGHEVTVFGSHSQSQKFQDGPVHVELIHGSRTKRIGWIFERLAIRDFVKRAVAEKRFDIIELVDHNGMLPWPVKGAPVVVRLHLSWTVWWRHFGAPPRPRWMRYCEKKTLAGHPHWLGCSQYILNETTRVFGVSPKSSQVVYNPFPGRAPAEVKPWAAREKIILFAGRISIRKGALTVAEAAKIFLPQLPEHRLVFVGAQDVVDGKVCSEACRKIVGDELAKRLQFTDRVGHEEVLAWMSKAQVLVFPSKLEAFSIVVLEAMTLGVPVVYSRNHSGPEVINDGINGCLADPDSPAEIAEKVLAICRNPEKAQKMADEGRKTVANRFTPKHCAEETLRFYNDTLKGQTGRQ